MDLEYLGLLETRVQGLIDLLRTTKDENQLLKTSLSEKTEALQHLQEERGQVRLRVEKILGTLSHMSEDSEPNLENQHEESRLEQETAY